ncbi:hypothetical protein AVO44_07180 [Ruegeria profundi]|uniref:Uncharacterized protein n=2 Tax=Ruegeria profundi TaxID=1685378 RepID=A0A0X3TW71_9RHOB|nr:hypothetical protein AVO44_07180 [Ruegeria profundi]
MIAGLVESKRYLVVTPLLSECERIIRDARVAFMQPEVIQDDPEIDTKKDHLIALLEARHNVVTTHAMFNNLADVEKMGLLDGYEIIIDEVMSVVDDGYRVKKKTWEQFYVNDGYVDINPDTGLITPTDLWVEHLEDVDDALSTSLYHAANAGRLYHLSDGINLAVMPEGLLKAGNSLTVYTYKAEGSIMFAYLKRLGLDPVHDTGSPEIEQRFVRQARELITVKDIRTLRGINLSYTSQTKTNSKKLDELVPKALSGLRRNRMSEVWLPDILITTPKSKWYRKGKDPKIGECGELLTPFKPGPYASGSRLSPAGHTEVRATWVPNTTRGTNDYKHCTHAIYLYDQNINPSILNWFGGPKVISNDDYALTELIQWLWRTQVRDGYPITLFLPSQRMQELLLNWLWEGQIPPNEWRKIRA